MSAACGFCCEHLQSDNALSSTPCGHVFHRRCLREWLRRSLTCPECRCNITEAMIEPVYLRYRSRSDELVRENDQLNLELHQLRKLAADLEKGKRQAQKQRQKLIEALTARCSGLETSNRKLESELEKRVNEISTLQKSRAMKEKPQSPS